MKQNALLFVAGLILAGCGGGDDGGGITAEAEAQTPTVETTTINAVTDVAYLQVHPALIACIPSGKEIE